MDRDEERNLSGSTSGKLWTLPLRSVRYRTPAGYELPMADFLEIWLKDAGLTPFRQHIAPESDNVVALLRGAGGGPSLLFNSQMAVGAPTRKAPLSEYALPADGSQEKVPTGFVSLADAFLKRHKAENLNLLPKFGGKGKRSSPAQADDEIKRCN